MVRTSNLFTVVGEYVLHEVEALGNQRAVIDGSTIYVADTGHRGVNEGIALAAAGSLIDVGLLAWPALHYSWDSI